MARSKGRKRQTDETVLVEGGTLGRDEIVEILEDLARNGGPSSKIQAIRLLRDMADAEEGPNAQGFDALDAGDEVGARRKAKGA